MNHRGNSTLFFASIHIETGKESKEFTRYHYLRYFAMDAGHKESVPIDTNHGDASRLSHQQYTKCHYPQVYISFPRETCLLLEVKHLEALKAEIK